MPETKEQKASQKSVLSDKERLNEPSEKLKHMGEQSAQSSKEEQKKSEPRSR